MAQRTEIGVPAGIEPNRVNVSPNSNFGLRNVLRPKSVQKSIVSPAATISLICLLVWLEVAISRTIWRAPVEGLYTWTYPVELPDQTRPSASTATAVNDVLCSPSALVSR